MKGSTKRMLILGIVVVVAGGGGWYFLKSSACEKKISYVPSEGSNGAYYRACVGNPISYFPDGCPKFATHKEAMSACVGI